MNLTGLIMDAVLVALLLAALAFGMRLNTRLKTLRAGQEEFARAVAELDSAAIRAYQSLKELRSDADDSQELLHGRIVAARDILQKLEAQVGRAERAAREIDGQMGSLTALQGRAEQTAKRLESAPRQVAPAPPARPVLREVSAEPVREPAREAPRRQPKLEEDADYNPAWSASPKTPNVARGQKTPEGKPDKRDPFERDVISFRSPAASTFPDRAGQRKSLLPDLPDEDEAEMLDKVQMSELVVANLNEMIRTLTLPPRRVLSVEDDLFGDDK
ncbi:MULTISPECIES: DUF6468 domain-containing protein [Asticcacaulis]|uniref:DUF6468 domain-containing protein n=1 Tax=Asticcacaulis TaxID=76890 RepID=UPI001AE9E27E|nr:MULTISPECIES: DUF6468 domain-containing protein [Asticcacaulis]MBP2157574.1 hypothetical protein [Asticcacaulis solisilvae]MDR6798619.1 hypothetical protein [Asticcacaulis sp. BE141]